MGCSARLLVADTAAAQHSSACPPRPGQQRHQPLAVSCNQEDFSSRSECDSQHQQPSSAPCQVSCHDCCHPLVVGLVSSRHHTLLPRINSQFMLKIFFRRNTFISLSLLAGALPPHFAFCMLCLHCQETITYCDPYPILRLAIIGDIGACALLRLHCCVKIMTACCAAVCGMRTLDS